MKNIVFLVLLFCVNNLIYGQNNLSFSQAMIIDLPAFTQAPLTVPPNKVWKIEANAQNSAGNPRFTINDLAFEKGADSGPIWLNSGHTIKQGAGTPPAVRASVIEFEVSAGSGGSGGGSGYGSEGLAFAGVIKELLPITFSQGTGSAGNIVVPENTIYKITSATISGLNGGGPVYGWVNIDGEVYVNNEVYRTRNGNTLYLSPGSYAVTAGGVPSSSSNSSRQISITGVAYSFIP